MIIADFNRSGISQSCGKQLEFFRAGEIRVKRLCKSSPGNDSGIRAQSIWIESITKLGLPSVGNVPHCNISTLIAGSVKFEFDRDAKETSPL